MLAFSADFHDDGEPGLGERSAEAFTGGTSKN